MYSGVPDIGRGSTERERSEGGWVEGVSPMDTLSYCTFQVGCHWAIGK